MRFNRRDGETQRDYALLSCRSETKTSCILTAERHDSYATLWHDNKLLYYQPTANRQLTTIFPPYGTILYSIAEIAAVTA